MQSHLNRGLFTAASLAALLLATSTEAQTPPSASAVAADQVGEVVVTAQKRTENVQRVPLAITVVGADVMRQNNITSAEGIGQLVPSLTFKKGTTNLNSTLSVRGVGTQSFASGAEPSVSTVVDGVVFGRSGQAFQEFTDLDHIEVLRGPQGTLFGKNASAGAISIVTRTPGRTRTGDASVGYYEGGEVRANANLSGPISDRMRFGVSALYGDYDGNVLNRYTAKWTNGFRRAGARGVLVFDATNDLKITVRGDWVHASDNCCADVLGNYLPSPAFSGLIVKSIAPVNAAFGSKEISNNLTPQTVDSNGGASAQIDYSVGDFTLTSVSAWRDWRNKQIRDGDYHSVDSTHVSTADINDRDFGALNYDQFSEELRLASPTGQKLEYVVGAFLWYTNENDWFTRFVDQCTASTLAVDSTGTKPCSTAPGVSTFVHTSGPAAWNTQFYNQALFGQATYGLTDRLKMIGGLRYTHDRVAYSYNRVNNPVPGPGIGAPFSYRESTSADGISAKAGLQYQYSADVMTYATYSRGYKGPSLNVFYSVGAANTAPIAPETANAYEAGVKTQFFDHQVTVNADVFWEDFDNFQANSFTLLNGLTTVTLGNAGSIRSRGVELDGSWRATPDLTFSGGLTYDEAIIVKYNCPATLAPASLNTCLLHDGRRLPFAPKEKFNLSANWRLPFSDQLPVDVRLNSTYSYSSLINFDLDQTPLARQPSYGLLDGGLTFTTKDGRYRLNVIGKNLTNQYYVTFITPGGNGVAPGSYTRLQVPRDAQRYFGVTASASF